MEPDLLLERNMQNVADYSRTRETRGFRRGSGRRPAARLRNGAALSPGRPLRYCGGAAGHAARPQRHPGASGAEGQSR